MMSLWQRKERTRKSELVGLQCVSNVPLYRSLCSPLSVHHLPPHMDSSYLQSLSKGALRRIMSFWTLSCSPPYPNNRAPGRTFC